MRKTMEALVTDAERLLYQSAGPSVQIYSQDILIQKLQNAFDHCFTSKFWPQFRKREVRWLDGVTGSVSVPFTYISQWDDVSGVFRRNSSRPIPIMPESYNILDLNDGPTIKFVEPRDDVGLFTAYPLTAVDAIVVVGRYRPIAPFTLTDVVPFDHLALVYFAVWSYFTDDDSNPAAAAKYQALFDSRMKQLEDDSFGNAVLLDSNSGYVPNTWTERG